MDLYDSSDFFYKVYIGFCSSNCAPNCERLLLYCYTDIKHSLKKKNSKWL